jgi:methionine-rich copper-binding protein CopC
MKKFLFIICLILACPIYASAHTTVSASNPSAGEIITEEISELKVEFAGAIENQGSLTLVKEQEEIKLDSSVNDKQIIGTLTTPLENGNYLLTWKVASTDGHVLTGDIPFTVNIPDTEIDEEVQDETEQVDKTKENIEKNDAAVEEKAEIEAASETVKDNSSLFSSISVIVLVVLLAFGIWILLRKKR